MATIASIFTLKLENKDFNAQLQTAAKSSQDYNNKIANSLLEAAKQEAKLVTLLKQKSELQASGSKAGVTLKNQEIAATKSLIQAENASIKQAERSIAIQVEGAKRIIAADKELIRSKQEVGKVMGIQPSRGGISSTGTPTGVTSRETLRSSFETAFLDTAGQARYKAQVQELNSLKSQGIISENEYATAIKKTNDAIKQGEPIRDNQFNHMIRMLRWAGTLAATFYGLKTAWDATIGTGINAAAQFEEMNIGIAALIATNSTNVTAMGKHITASEKFTMAQKEAANATILLRQANIDTPATLEQVTKGFQAALGPALGLGLNIKQTVEYARLMTIAAMSMRVPMEQLSQETRSILEGSIDQNSIVAKNLDITNAQMKRHIEQGDVYEWLIKKLSDFNSAGDAVNKSWSGVTSDLSDSWRAFTADFVKSSGIFDGLKSSLSDLSKLLKNQKGEMDDLVTTSVHLAEVIGGVTAVYYTYTGLQKLSMSYTALATSTTIAYNLATNLTTTSVTRLTVAQVASTLATRAWTAALNVNPFVIAAGAIAAGIYGIVKAMDAFSATQDENEKRSLSYALKQEKYFRSYRYTIDEIKKPLAELEKQEKAYLAGVEAARKSGNSSAEKVYQDNVNRIQKEKKVYQDAIKEQEKNAVVASKAKTPGDSLVAKPKEKTAEELEKEAKKRQAELDKQNREEVKAYELKKSLIEAEMAMQGRQTVEAEVRTKVDQDALREKFALEFKLQDIRKERFDAEVATAKAELSDENTRRNKIALLVKAYETDRKEFMTWELTQQEKINAGREKGYRDAAKAAYVLFDRETAIAQRGLNNQDRGFDFVNAFGRNKVGIEEYQKAIDGIISSSERALNSTVSAFVDKGVFSEEANAELVENFNRLDNTVQSKIDHWQDRLARIPDIELNLRLNGVDGVTNALSTVVNNFADMTRANAKFNTQSVESKKQIKALEDKNLDTTEEKLKLDKLITQNNYDQIATYQAIAGAVSGVFKEGSKEAAAFMIVQQGLALTNAVTGIAMALGSSPWTGIATAAAAAAFIAPMLSQIGVVLGMSKTSTTSDAFSARASNEGKGSALGDTSASSESITRSLELMGELAKPEFKLITQMNKSLISIDQKMGGVASLLIRKGGFATGEGYEGWDTGFKLSGGKQFAGELFAGGTIGQTFKLLDPFVKNIPIIGDINKLMGGIVSGIGSFIGGGLFGKTSVSQNMTDSGIYFADALLQNAVDTFEGSAYQTISTTVSKKSWFSKSSSTSISTYFAGLNDEVERQFSLVLSGLYDTTLLAGQALDTASSDIETDLSDFVVSIGKVSLKGKTGDEIQENLANIFGKIADEIALDVFPLLTPFQRVGEGLFETMTRVAGGMEEAAYYINRLGLAFNDVVYSDLVNKQGDVALEALRQSILALEGTSNGVSQIIQGLSGDVGTLYDTYASLDRLRFALSAIGTSSDGLTSSMLYGAGGIDALEEATQNYIESFLSESEQVSYQASLMSDAFSDLGLALPSTKQGFTELLKSIDVSTESGQDLYGRLILLSNGFSDLTESVTAAFSDITAQAQSLSDAFTSMSNSIQDTIDKLLSTASGSSQSAMIGAFWDKRAQADVLLAKRGDLTVKEQQTLQSLVNDIDALAINIQGAQVGPKGSITSSLVGQLQDLKSNVDLDNAIVQSRILDANGQVTNVATEGTLTRLANAMAERNAMLGIDGSHADGLGYVPFDGYVAQLHKGERVLTAAEANGFGGRTVINFDTSALEVINNKIYDRINLMYNILNDAQLGARPLYVRS